LLEVTINVAIQSYVISLENLRGLLSEVWC